MESGTKKKFYFIVAVGKKYNKCFAVLNLRRTSRLTGKMAFYTSYNKSGITGSCVWNWSLDPKLERRVFSGVGSGDGQEKSWAGGTSR